ncbi:DoxX family protein [Flavobacterium aquariorum]|uniref:DoxX family protein n=1 Tax=Flavobacterium aquariorum TaxID=2217670 RepID=A0A2W7TSK0_9FLAO|nr:DoxX family protein [Flavobacterium aquariorum]PZX93038.1 DoxX family protein [Flavobacterium aquariorum]
MKTATFFIRTIIGLLLVFVSVAYFFNLMPDLASTGDFKAFQLGLISSVYLMPMVKTIELLCGISYLTGQYVALSNLIVLPVSTNILFINFFLNPNGIPLALFVFLGNLFLIYVHWKNYKSLFTRKSIKQFD